MEGHGGLFGESFGCMMTYGPRVSAGRMTATTERVCRKNTPQKHKNTPKRRTKTPNFFFALTREKKLPSSKNQLFLLVRPDDQQRREFPLCT